MVDYEGILEGYPRIEKRVGILAAIIQLIRPYTLLAPIIAGVLGTLAPVETVSQEYIITGIYAGFTLALAQACGQVLNQYADAELDRIVKPYRPIPRGVLRKEEAMGIGWIFALISLGRGFMLNELFGTINLTLVFFAVFYSMAPFSPRRIHPLANILWMSISRGFLPVIAVYSIYGNPFDGLRYALLGFIWVLGFQGTKDVPDMAGDRAYGIKTIPNQWGEEGLLKWMIFSLFIFTGISISLDMTLYSYVYAALGTLSILTLRTRTDIAENNVAWLLMYLGIGLNYVLMYFN